MVSEIKAKTLLLDKNWQPIKIISWKCALNLLFLKKAHTVSEYPDLKVRSTSKAFSVPAILRSESTPVRVPRRTPCTSANIFLRDKNLCAYCGVRKSKSDLTVDHVIPIVQGGEWDWKNLISACRKCNQKKGGRTPKQAGMKLLFQPKEPGWSLVFALKISKSDPIHFWQDYLYGLEVYPEIFDA